MEMLEKELINKAKSGDNNAFEELVKLYRHKIKSIAVNHGGGNTNLVKELEAIGIKGLWHSLKNFNFDRCKGKPWSYFSAYIAGGMISFLKKDYEIIPGKYSLDDLKESRRCCEQEDYFSSSWEQIDEKKKDFSIFFGGALYKIYHELYCLPVVSSKVYSKNNGYDWNDYLSFKYRCSIGDFENLFDFFWRAKHHSIINISRKLGYLKKKLKGEISNEERSEIKYRIERINYVREIYTTSSKNEKPIKLENLFLGILGSVLRSYNKTKRVETDWDDVIYLTKYLQRSLLPNHKIVPEESLNKKVLKNRRLTRLFNLPLVIRNKKEFFPNLKILDESDISEGSEFKKNFSDVLDAYEDI